MRRYLEIVTNIAIVCTCVLVVYTLLGSRPPARRSEAPKTPQKGERLQLQTDLDLQRADRTLVLVLRSGCQFCTESMPFYNRLAQKVRNERNGRAQLVVVTRDELDAAANYLREHSLVVQATVPLTATLAKTLRVPGTPALILLDRGGVVQDVWLGKLNDQGERAVEDALLDSTP